MAARRLGAAAAAAVCLGLVGAAQPPAPVHLGAVRTIAATTNHAAVVVDTGKDVKKFCLAFPEDEISGAEVLRRIDSQVVFANFGSRGQAVCSLCGTGCPSSNCFCDPNKFWAYHRAGPGGAPYAFSRTGASSTVVRNGDVEGWKWGAGEPPPPATVGEVCNIDEPAARTTAASPTSTTTTAAAGEAASSTTTSPEPAAPGATTTSADPNATTKTQPGPAGTSPTATVAGQSGVTLPTTPSPASGADPAVPAPTNETGAQVTGPTAAAVGASGDPAAKGNRASVDDRPAERGLGGVASLGVLALALAGILVWRSRVKRSRRANR